MNVKPLVLGDSASDQRKFITVVEFLNNGFNATRAYMSSHPNCSEDTAQKNAWKYFKDAGIKEEILQQLQRKFDANHIDVLEETVRLLRDAKTSPGVKKSCLELIAKIEGMLTERREVINKSDPAQNKCTQEEMIEMRVHMNMCLDDKWRKKESEVKALERVNLDLKNRLEKVSNEKVALEELLQDYRGEEADNKESVYKEHNEYLRQV